MIVSGNLEPVFKIVCIMVLDTMGDSRLHEILRWTSHWYVLLRVSKHSTVVHELIIIIIMKHACVTISANCSIGPIHV